MCEDGEGGRVLVMTILPTIMLRESYRRSDDHGVSFFRQILPLIRRSNFGFFADCYRRSEDQISVFLTTATDDPTIKIRFFPLILAVDPSHFISLTQLFF